MKDDLELKVAKLICKRVEHLLLEGEFDAFSEEVKYCQDAKKAQEFYKRLAKEVIKTIKKYKKIDKCPKCNGKILLGFPYNICSKCGYIIKNKLKISDLT